MSLHVCTLSVRGQCLHESLNWCVAFFKVEFYSKKKRKIIISRHITCQLWLINSCNSWSIWSWFQYFMIWWFDYDRPLFKTLCKHAAQVWNAITLTVLGMCLPLSRVSVLLRHPVVRFSFGGKQKWRRTSTVHTVSWQHCIQNVDFKSRASKLCVHSFHRWRFAWVSIVVVSWRRRNNSKACTVFCKPLAHFAWAFLAVMFVKNVFETFKATKSKSKFYISYTREEKTCLQIVGLITT